MSKPVRVLFVHNSVLIGGGNRVLLGLFEQLDRDRFEPWSLLPGDGPMEPELRTRKVPYIFEDVLSCLMKDSRLSTAAAAAALAWKTGRKKFGIIHAQSPISYKLPSAVAKFSSTRRICHLHFPPSDVEKELEYAFKVKPHCVISCSKSVADGYRAGLEALCPGVALRVLVNFADTERFKPGPPPEALVRERIARQPAHHHYLRANQRAKGASGPSQSIEVRARKISVRALPHRGEDLLLRGEYQRKMEAMAAELGVASGVRFLGFRSDVADVMRASDVIVLPSYAEGMPLSLLEASACAKPIVAYNIPGVDEVVEDGRTGRLVSVGDVDALAKALCDLAGTQDLCETLGAQGRTMVEQQFSLTAYTNRLESLYEETLAAAGHVRTPAVPAH